jgi:hypothetical protein
MDANALAKRQTPNSGSNEAKMIQTKIIEGK